MKAIYKITSVFLVIAFLLSSLGFTVNKMICLKSGKTKISFTPVKNCCPAKKSTIPVVKANCCDLHNTAFNLDDFSASQKVNTPFAITAVLPVCQDNFSAIKFSNNNSQLFFSDLPPPASLHGRQLLSFISTLRI
jgi:hypothetical protein